MRSRENSLWGVLLFGLCLSMLAGCRRVPEPKTILLPEEETEQGVALQGEEGDRYAVRKMYNEEYSSMVYGGYTAFLPETGEHQVRLAESGTDGLRVRTLDYRYGFYDTELLPAGELMAAVGATTAWKEGNVDEQRMEMELFSPDGKYLLYVRLDQSYTGGRLYLLNLETGEEELLLDGDMEECSNDQFMILTAWSRDGSLLCYGFYPRNVDIWNSEMADKFRLHYRDMESGDKVNQLNYYYAGTVGKTLELPGTQLYVDWEGKDILTCITSEIMTEGKNTVSNQKRIDFFEQKIPEPGRETEGVVMPHVANCPKNAKLYPDAGSGSLYFTSPEEGIIALDTSHGAYVSSMPISPARGIWDFCVLDDGEAFVVAEYDRDHIGEYGPQDICLYTMTEEGMARRVLYQNAGNVVRLQYDPIYRRLLAETGVVSDVETISYTDTYTEEHIIWDGERRALVLEF